MNEAARWAIVALWYRDQMRATVPALIAKWEAVMGVKVTRVLFRK